MPIFMIRQKFIPGRPLFRSHFPFAVNGEPGKRFFVSPARPTAQQFASDTGNRRSRPAVLISAALRTNPYPSVKKFAGDRRTRIMGNFSIRICTDKNGGYGEVSAQLEILPGGRLGIRNLNFGGGRIDLIRENNAVRVQCGFPM